MGVSPSLSFSFTADKHFSRGRRNRSSLRCAVESVERRLLLAVTASFAGTTLTVTGDALDNTITVSRNAAGTILVNGGAVAVVGGTPTVANTALIQVFGLAGSDTITLSETNGALPASNQFGGAGNDILTGGSGGDQLFGQADNDQLLGKGGIDLLFGGTENDTLTGGDADDQSHGESGNDRMIWNPGDDTDLNEGGDGTDTTEVNGGNGAEVFTTTANGLRVRFDRIDPAPFSIDIGTTENLVLNANGGNDSASNTGNLAALISITLDGGTGNDTLLGSNGADLLLGGDNDDFIDGQQGNDVALMGAGNDVFQWDPGDGSDVIEGQDGADSMLFNGSAGNEIFAASANGGRVLFTRNLGAITIDLNGVEQLDLNMLGGVDSFTVNDLSGTDLTNINVNLSGTIGGAAGDAAADSVIVNGTTGNNTIDVFGAGTSLAIVGLTTSVNVTNSEGANDSLTVNALAGNDNVSATTLPAGVVKLTLDGGINNDTLLGSQGADVFFGGDGNDSVFGDNGNDTAFLGAGDDTFQWDPGDGNDVVEGQDNADRLTFLGSNAAENITIAANGGRVLFFRDVASVTMDLNDLETIEFRAFGGADGINVADLSGTDVTQVKLDLQTASTGDGASDTITVNATQAADSFSSEGTPGTASVTGLQALVTMIGTEPLFDRLVINGLGADDVINASNLPASAIALTLNGGLGNDLLIGGNGGEFFNGGDGNDVALMGAGNDTFVWNPGDDNDILEGQADLDIMLFNGANIAENINIAANGGRVRFSRDVAAVLMDLNDVERIDFNALGGADNVTLADTTGTDLTTMSLNLSASGGGGDGAADTVNFNGGAAADVMNVNGDVALLSVVTNAVTTFVAGIEPANDVFNFNGAAGADTFAIGSLTGVAGMKMNFNFGGTDNAADLLTVAGTTGADSITVADTLNSTTISGLVPTVEIFSAEAVGDALRVNALGGSDTIVVNQTAGVGSVHRTLIDAGDAFDTLTITNTPANGAAVILPSTGNDNVGVNLDGLFSANAIFQGTQRIGVLSVGTSGLASIAANGSSVLTMSSLSLSGTAKLDIANNHAIIDYSLGQASPLAVTRSRIVAGFNSGAWNGPGIISSNAATNPNKAVGYAEASALYTTFPATFQGQSIDNTAVLLSFTFKGDATLDRNVGFDDLLRLAQSYGTANGNWSAGDFNYSGNVNFDDLLSLAQNYNVVWLTSPLSERQNKTFASRLIV